ncbi:hypothetical protein EIN_096300 [Entamoeba invadens IP1]|uniref:Uncharacterized protein n=1 Tax=Entamoeba invadens IP1 TaxID=370355 RepID=A0A0A1U3S6_ENTIV|nr:hypothetical protein EIN_096300 [Entamoeba invadens IP1]ELP87373.1 hypothetical protein EIN_096300 [Entamoeba invadens IP1]|eukprot:XP_004254144.1 hypothetical protein EIN_096300 [Entamoeba invadens IP1]
MGNLPAKPPSYEGSQNRSISVEALQLFSKTIYDSSIIPPSAEILFHIMTSHEMQLLCFFLENNGFVACVLSHDEKASIFQKEENSTFVGSTDNKYYQTTILFEINGKIFTKNNTFTNSSKTSIISSTSELTCGVIRLQLPGNGETSHRCTLDITLDQIERPKDVPQQIVENIEHLLICVID